MTDLEIIEKLEEILIPIYEQGRITEEEGNAILYYATLNNSEVGHSTLQL